MDDDCYNDDEVAIAQMERDAWQDYQDRYEKPVLTCGGVGVNFAIDAGGRIIFL